MQSKEDKMNSYLVNTLLRSVRHYVSFIAESHQISGGYKSTKGVEHYGFVPTDISAISDTLLRLYFYISDSNDRPISKCKFLDIGCGIGNIVLLAYDIGFNAHGLEYNKKIYNIAKKLAGGCHIFRGDMTNFERYYEYDVLYYYIPIADREVMEVFAEKLAKVMKPGAYIIPYGMSDPFHRSEEFKKTKLGLENYPPLPVFKKKGEKYNGKV